MCLFANETEQLFCNVDGTDWEILNWSSALIVFTTHTKKQFKKKKKTHNVDNFFIHKSNYCSMGLIQQADEKGNERTEEKEQRKGGRKRLYESVSCNKRPSRDVLKEL